MCAQRGEEPKVVAQNRKARHLYHILETVEAGIALTGNEVKSVRAGQISLDESYARPEGGELFLVGCHIAPYEKTGFDRPEPKRKRKLLLKRSEIKRFTGRVTERGLTLVPLRVYFKGPWAKVELALAKGKGRSDRREELKRRSAMRDIERALSRRRPRGMGQGLG